MKNYYFWINYPFNMFQDVPKSYTGSYTRFKPIHTHTHSCADIFICIDHKKQFFFLHYTTFSTIPKSCQLIS